MSGVELIIAVLVVGLGAAGVAVVVQRIDWRMVPGACWMVLVGLALWAVSRWLPRSRPPSARRDERGVAVLEFVLLVPVFLLMVFFVVGLGRLGQARENIDGAARDAARAASMARSPGDARIAAEGVATDALATHDLTCANLAVNVDTGDFRAGGWVRVDLSCTVTMADLTGVWTPGSKTMAARGLAVVDEFRRVG
jgi:Flp pilus assembly protein TadG